MRKKRSINPLWISLLVTVLFFGFITMVITKGETSIAKSEQELYTQSIINAALTCYGNEGFYPASLDYLYDNYGLVENKHFHVFYEVVGSNIMPTIKVVNR